MIEKIPFNDTGHESSRIIFGGVALAGVSNERATKILDFLKDHGVNHIDTASSYGNSEVVIGNVIEDYRDDFFLATKFDSVTYQNAKEEIHGSLERLNVDHVDLLQRHELLDFDELESFFGKDGAIEALIEAKEKGLTKHVGVTTHGMEAPKLMLAALDRYDFDSVLLPFNYALMQDPEYSENFEELLDTCKRRNIAVQTTKSLARGDWGDQEQTWETWYRPLENQEEIDKSVHWILSHPEVFLCSVGDIDLLPKVLDAAERFDGEGPSEKEMENLKEDLDLTPPSDWPGLGL